MSVLPPEFGLKAALMQNPRKILILPRVNGRTRHELHTHTALPPCCSKATFLCVAPKAYTDRFLSVKSPTEYSSFSLHVIIYAHLIRATYTIIAISAAFVKFLQKLYAV